MDTSLGLLLIPRVISFQFIVKLQVLGIGLGVDFTFVQDYKNDMNDKNQEPSPKFSTFRQAKRLRFAMLTFLTIRRSTKVLW